jgi:hypothetical protein
MNAGASLLAAALAFLSGMTAAGASEPALDTASTTHVDADFTIYVGGLLFIKGKFAAILGPSGYSVTTDMGTAGAARTFYPAEYRLASEGSLEEARIRPAHYVSDTWSRHSARKVSMSYDGDGMPRMTAEPPYEPGDLADVMPYQQLGTQDPVSAFVMPVVQGQNPCERSIAVFDGRRRYDLKLSYEGEKKKTPRGLSGPMTAVVCNIKYVPVAPVEQRKFTNMLRRNDDMKVWLVPFDGGRVYMPVRFQLRTPLGGAVMELADVRERAARQASLQKPR